MSDLDPSKLDKLKVSELQEELKNRGLDSKGKKAVLVKRLKEALASDLDESVGDVNTSQDTNDESSQDVSQNSIVEEQDSVVHAEPSPVKEAPPAPEPVIEEPPAPEPEPEPEPVKESPKKPEPVTELPMEPEPVKESPVKQSPGKKSPRKSEPVVESAQENASEEPMEQDKGMEEIGSGSDQVQEKTEEMQVVEGAQNEANTTGGEKVNGSAETTDDMTVNVDIKVEDKQDDRGTKRKRSRSRSHERERPKEQKDQKRSPREKEKKEPPKPQKPQQQQQPPRRRGKSPIEQEDDTWWDWKIVSLDKYNSDLNLKIDRTGFKAEPLSFEGFAMVWAGARGTYGITKGKVAFECKLLENQDVRHLGEEETNPHVCRVGWSTDDNTMQLGEEELSYGYGGTAKASTECKFTNYGEKFSVGDVITAYLDLDSDPGSISFSKNGKDLGECFTVDKSKLGEKALFPHILTKNISFEVHFGAKEEPWFPLKEGYVFIDKVDVEERVRGTLQPEKKEDCEMLMMVGLPACGKTTWAEKQLKAVPEAKYNILGTNSIIDRMKVMGLPRKRNYAGRWDVLIDRSTKCLNRMFEYASQRKRNYILDQVFMFCNEV